MKKLFILTTMIVALAALSSCSDDDKNSYPPTWKGFQLSPARPTAGDSLTVTARQDQKGHLINATKYEWTLNCTLVKNDGGTEEVTLTETDQTNYDGLSSADPVHKFLIPKEAAGRATITFQATYNYSAQGIEVDYGGDYSRPAGMMGTILSRSGQMSGGASGSVNFMIVNN